MTTGKPIALITGATSGIGHEFAVQLARRGHDLVIVARDYTRLQQVARDLGSTYAAHVETIVADLSDRAALQTVADRLADRDRPIDVLVNNAGYGSKTAFLKAEIRAEEAMLDVLVRAVLVLSHAAAVGMRERGTGSIINVSSVAGFLTSGTYSAAKSWVTVFTEGLSMELADSGVSATALCPGFTHTEFHERARLSKPGPDFLWLEADQLVADCLDDVAKGRVVSVPSLQYKAVVGLLRVLPRSLVRSRGQLRRRR